MGFLPCAGSWLQAQLSPVAASLVDASSPYHFPQHHRVALGEIRQWTSVTSLTQSMHSLVIQTLLLFCVCEAMSQLQTGSRLGGLRLCLQKEEFPRICAFQMKVHLFI